MKRNQTNFRELEVQLSATRHRNGTNINNLMSADIEKNNRRFALCALAVDMISKMTEIEFGRTHETAILILGPVIIDMIRTKTRECKAVHRRSTIEVMFARFGYTLCYRLIQAHRKIQLLGWTPVAQAQCLADVSSEFTYFSKISKNQ